MYGIVEALRVWPLCFSAANKNARKKRGPSLIDRFRTTDLRIMELRRRASFSCHAEERAFAVRSTYAIRGQRPGDYGIA
jgi:hypothetical protein